MNMELADRRSGLFTVMLNYRIGTSHLPRLPVGKKLISMCASRWRDRQYFGPKRWLETALRDPAWQVSSSI
jgi:hypothetical protein